MVACKCWPGRAGAGGSITGGHDREAFSGAPRPAGSERRPRRSRQQRQSFLARNKCRLPLASGARAENDADLRGLQAAGRTMHETCRRMFRPRGGGRALRALATDYLARAAGPAGLGRALFVGIGSPATRPPSPQGEQHAPQFAIERSTAEQEIQRRDHASPHLRCGIAIAMGRNRTCM